MNYIQPAALQRLLVLSSILWITGGCQFQATQSKKEAPQRVISTAPSLTEMLFAIGAEGRIVGVTTYCDYPPEALKKPKIGSFASPNMETVISMNPDLVVVLDDRQDLEAKFRSLGIEYLVLNNRHLKGIFTSIRVLGERLDLTSEATYVIGQIKSDLEKLAAQLRDLPRPRVLVLIGRNPGTLSDLYAVGSDSYLGALIELAGGENIFQDAPGYYPKVSIEEVAVRDPEIILDISHGEGATPEEIARIRKLWGRLPSISAVQSGRLFVSSNDLFIVPGTRVAEIVRRLAEMFHGEVE